MRKGIGDCYEKAVLAILRPQFYARDLKDYDLTLVHGEVLGTGGNAEGIRYGHAWLEYKDQGTDWVIDRSNGRDGKIPKRLYYQAGNIKDNIYRYTKKQASKLMNEFNHYGPWELETESGY